jgi:uncharacterized protein YdaU (DUF1376 family)
VAGVSKQPFLPLFFGDFLASTAEWSGEEASLYLTLLGYQWTGGTLPADPAKLARLVRWDRKAFDRCWPQVSSKFQAVGDRLVNARLEQHRAKSDELAEKNRASGRKGAEARWRKDGERHSPAIADAKEALWQSIPSHPIPSKNSVEPSSPEPSVVASPPHAHAHARTREAAPIRVDELVAAEVSREAIEEWRQHRDALGKPLRPHELIVFGKVLRGAGSPSQQLATVRNCIANGWANLRHADTQATAPVIQTWEPPDDEPEERRA